jgi:hypothetical protein
MTARLPGRRPLTNHQLARMPARYRFWIRVRVRSRDACWPWRGAVNKISGYGQFAWAHSRHEGAHRVAFRLAHGDIPPGMHVHHTCEGSPLCVNPRHLQLQDPATHGRISSADNWGTLGDADACRWGHTGERHRRADGSWHCRACAREQTAARRRGESWH